MRHQPKIKPQNFKKAIVSLLKYCKSYSFLFILAVVLAMTSSVLTLIGPKKISEISNIINSGVSYNYTLTEEEFANLDNSGFVELEIDVVNYQDLSLNYQGNDCSVSVNKFILELDDEDNISFVLDCIIEGRSENIVYTASLTTLNQQGEFLFSNSPFGLTLSNNQLSVWFNITATINIQAIVNIALVLIIIYCLSFVFGYLQNFLLSTVTAKIGYNMRSDISKKLNKLPLSFLDGMKHGDILSRVTNDADTVAMSLSNSLASLASSIVLLLGSLLVMFITQPLLAGAAILSSILGFVLTSIIMTKSHKFFHDHQYNMGMLNGHVEEAYSGHNIIKVYNAGNQFKEIYGGLNKNLFTSGWKSQFMGGLMHPIMNFIGNFCYVVVCVIGSVLAVNGVISFSVIVAFMIYIRLFNQPLSNISQSFVRLQSAAAAGERVFELLNEKELANEDNLIQHVDNVNGDVDFKNVVFGYDKEKDIIKNFTATVKAGQKVAIVGPTGAGKTTLVNLIMKFYEVNSGEICIDGIPLNKLSRKCIHNMFGMVLQDTWLFNASVFENLKYNNESVTLEQVKSACKVCGVHHFIKTLPNGYDTVLDDNTTISAGQKQLLTIARAMIQNCPMLILDEATSSVDTRTEVLIQKAMDTLTKGRTSFVIAHRLSTIKNADIIFVLKDGDIVEQGNHDKLLNKGGFYASLYKSQFEE